MSIEFVVKIQSERKHTLVCMDYSFFITMEEAPSLTFLLKERTNE